MEIKDPKFKEGQKVRDIEDGDIYTVVEINRYSFSGNEYWYDLEADRKKYIYTRPESKLETYIDKPKTVWDLQNGDTYYVVDYNDMNAFKIVFYNDEIDLNHRYLGNCFLTKEEAESELERVKIEAEMLRLGGRRKFELGKANWYLEYRPMSGGIEAMWTTYEMRQGTIYYDSEEKAKKVVEIIGEDRIKKYIFGVEE